MLNKITTIEDFVEFDELTGWCCYWCRCIRCSYHYNQKYKMLDSDFIVYLVSEGISNLDHESLI